MFKAVFAVLGLLIALAIVGMLAKNQLAAFGLGSSRTTATATPGASAAQPPDAQAKIKGIQDELRNRTTEALQKGADRSEREQP